MTRIRLSGSARAYLRKEAAYLRERSRPAAETFLARLANALETLARFPEVGFSHGGLPVPGLSRLVVGDYLLDYEFAGDEIRVLSIRHGRQTPLVEPPDGDFDYEEPGGAS